MFPSGFLRDASSFAAGMRHEVTVFASERILSDKNWRLQRSQILFPVSSLKDEENGITKSATENNKSKYISSKWEEENRTC